jgi:hypothetical protein
VILGAAAERPDLSVLPLPGSLKLKGGALAKVIDSLRNRGLIRVIGTDGGPERVVITSEGMAAIGIETEGGEGAPAGAAEPDTGPTTSADSNAPPADAQAPTSEVDVTAEPAKRKNTRKVKAPKVAPVVGAPGAVTDQSTGKPIPRAGTKQAVMIEMLKRPEGATVEQIAAATGVEWRRSALPPCGDRFLRPPLRTGRASFPASGSPCSAYG